MQRADTAELTSRERTALRDENVGLRESRRNKVSWRALQALLEAAVPAVAA